VNPTGSLTPDTLVAVYFYDAVPTPAAPSSLTVSAGPYTPGSTFTISWPTYSKCPSGFALSNYQFTVSGGTLPSGASYSPGTSSTSVLVSNDTTEVRVSYVVTCGSLSSNPSDDLVVTVD
jgi:serine/threonine-protein kinase